MTAVLTGKRPEIRPIRDGAARPLTGRHLALYRPGITPGPTGAGPTGAGSVRPGGSLSAHRRVAPRQHPATRFGPDARPVPRLDPGVYRRRRLMAGGLLLLSIAAVLILAQLIQAGIGGGPLTATGAAAGPGMVPAGATQYVVRPGDTLWSIAAALEPGRDERPLVDQLVKETHGASLYPGEVIPLPAGH